MMVQDQTGYRICLREGGGRQWRLASGIDLDACEKAQRQQQSGAERRLPARFEVHVSARAAYAPAPMQQRLVSFHDYWNFSIDLDVQYRMLRQRTLSIVSIRIGESGRVPLLK